MRTHRRSIALTDLRAILEKPLTVEVIKEAEEFTLPRTGETRVPCLAKRETIHINGMEINRLLWECLAMVEELEDQQKLHESILKSYGEERRRLQGKIDHLKGALLLQDEFWTNREREVGSLPPEAQELRAVIRAALAAVKQPQ